MTLLDLKLTARYALQLFTFPFWLFGAIAGWMLKSVVVGLRDGRYVASEIAYERTEVLARPRVIHLPYRPPPHASDGELDKSHTTLPAVAGFAIYRYCSCDFPAVSHEDLVHHVDQVHPGIPDEERTMILNGSRKA